MGELREPAQERTREERDEQQQKFAPREPGQPQSEAEHLQSSFGNQGVRDALAGQPPRGGAADSAWSYLVDDAAAEVLPGQMRRGEFLQLVEHVVYRTAEDGLAPAGRTARDCPYLRVMFRYYGSQDANAVGRAMKRYAPETAFAGSASESAWMIGLRARDSVHVWASTGRIERAPEWDGETGALVAAQLRSGPGDPLHAGVRGRMESVFGASFGDVRVHTGAGAEHLAVDKNARALTVGQDIYFASGQFKPGTLVGDAILAHELAHVVQQRDSEAPGGAIADRGASHEFERDADSAAGTAVRSIWSRSLGAASGMMSRASVTLRSGLSLQRCGNSANAPAPGPLNFASSNFTPTGGGALLIKDLPAAASPSVDVRSAPYYSEGDVSATGGTDAEASDWQAGFLQTALTSRVAFDYQDAPTGTHLFNLVYRLAGPTMDGLKGGTPPWYHPISTKDFTATNTTLHPKMSDNPAIQPPWTVTGTNGTVATLASSSGKDEFCSWLVVRQKSTQQINYLNYDTWEVDWAANFNAAAKTGAGTGTGTRITGQGAGQGAAVPVITGKVANESSIVEPQP